MFGSLWDEMSAPPTCHGSVLSVVPFDCSNISCPSCEALIMSQPLPKDLDPDRQAAFRNLVARAATTPNESLDRTFSFYKKAFLQNVSSTFVPFIV